jgi:hypothetical protein
MNEDRVIKLGESFVWDKSLKKDPPTRLSSYRDVKIDKDGWISANEDQGEKKHSRLVCRK